jgi:acetylornithine deacetylase/succinyl-diaminopimelate desuccinylase-like protein
MSAADGLRDEVIELARELIRIETSNPPGNESAAARRLAEFLAAAGVKAELVGPDPERLNLIARIEGEGDGPSLMLMAHTDVVPAPPDGWSTGPFDGTVRGDRLIGRGATDMKNELAARAAAFAALASEGARPAGDVVLVAESDEERNVSDVGMSWLVRERPDVRCDFAINEGGGHLLTLDDGTRIVTVSVGEKQVTCLRVRVFGTAGHASVPGADNVVGHAADAIRQLLDNPPPLTPTPAVERALDALGAPPGPVADRIEWGRGRHPTLAGSLPAMAALTVTPTGTRTYEPSNVIPPYADVTCDCRALPGQTEADIRAHVAGVLGDRFTYELELLEPLAGGTESPIDTPLFAELERYVAERVPGARLVPVVSSGFTDSHWIRQAFGTVAYGFAPVIHGDPIAYLESAHADDESIELDDLAEMAEFHLRLLRAFG